MSYSKRLKSSNLDSNSISIISSSNNNNGEESTIIINFLLDVVSNNNNKIKEEIQTKTSPKTQKLRRVGKYVKKENKNIIYLQKLKSFYKTTPTISPYGLPLTFLPDEEIFKIISMFDIETFRFMSMRLKLSLALSRGMQPLYQVLTSDIVNFDKSRVVKLQHRIINKYEIKFSPKRWFTLPHEADLPNRA